MDTEIGRMVPLVITGVILVLCAFYLLELTRSYKKRQQTNLEGIEPFANPGAALENRVDVDCYDQFYAKVYDQLVQPAARAAMEVQVPIEWLEKQGRVKGDLRVADIGCGTGLHVELFARTGVRSVVGYDRSPDMIAEAKRKYPEQEFRIGDATVATMAAADQFDLVSLYYFTVYLVPERTAMLKNIFLWLAPGGTLVCHIVNKLKFDPVLEAASPFVGFSVQKYADDRITKSEVAFDEFDYVGDFQLHGSRGVYDEVFAFKDGRKRHHEQRVWMPNIDVMVGEIEAIGFKYRHHVDLTAIGYEYNYLFIFQK
jgi:SAM-dependent methyltransferase